MKELLIEEKAKAYDKALKVLHKYDGAHIMFTQDLKEEIFPELKESEDERIRKSLIGHLKECRNNTRSEVMLGEYAKWIAWLEKQGEQSFANSCKTCKGEQNPVIIPKFRVGDKIRSLFNPNAIGNIIRIDKDLYIFDNGGYARIEFQDNWKLVEHADKTEPKFKKGDVIRRKDGDGLEWTVEDLHKDGYYTIVNSDRDDFVYLDDNWELVEQKSADKVEPKFKVGDLVVNNNGEPQLFQVISRSWPDSKIKRVPNNLEMFINTVTLDKRYHLWTIQDAKAGDVLRIGNTTFIFAKITDDNCQHKSAAVAYCSYEDEDAYFGVSGPDCITDLDEINPSTKEQRDLLFQKMKEAGYEWNAEKKELLKIEQKPVEWNIQDAKKGDILSNGTIVLIFDSVGKFEGRDIINSWYYADPEKFYDKGTSECDQWETEGFRPASEAEKNYLFKMMNKEGYMWDSEKNEIVDIEKPVEWSEEDERWLDNAIVSCEQCGNTDTADWLKSLKDRVLPQPKQEWSEEDNKMISMVITDLNLAHDVVRKGVVEKERKKEIEWLKSLRPQKHWKPSEEQIKNLESLYHSFGSPKIDKEVKDLIEQLKAL